MIDFLFGAIVGAWGVIVLAMYFGRRSQAQGAELAPRGQKGIAATSISLGNNAEPQTTLADELAIFKQLDRGNA